jgi:hypothetical protein
LRDEKNPHPALSQRERGKSSKQKDFPIGVREGRYCSHRPDVFREGITIGYGDTITKVVLEAKEIENFDLHNEHYQKHS